MKFKVGDVVRVRSDIEVDTYDESGVTFIDEMTNSLGKYDIIDRVDESDNTYKLVNNSGYWYAEDWLIECPQKGDEVTITDDLEAGDDYEVYVCDDMEQFRGATAEVVDCIVSRFRNRIEYTLNLPGGWTWTCDMFKGFEKGKGETEMDVENMELPTLMDKTANYDFDPSVINVLTDAAIPFLHKYDYNATEFGVKEIIKEWQRQKAWLIALMCKHEYYNGNFQIVIPAKLKEPVDVDNVIRFRDWAITEFEKSYKAKEVKIGMFTYGEVKRIKSAYFRIWDNLLPHATLNGFPRAYYGAEYNRYDNMLDEKIKELGGIEEVYLDGDSVYVSTEDYKNIRRFRNIMTELFDGIGDSSKLNPHLFTDVQANNVNSYAKAMGLKAKAAEGQKLSKYIGKLLKETGLNHIVDIQKTTWTSSNGEVHERVKDMGYNYYFALIGDSINPKEFETEVVLSVNPFDFWTMSFGDSWASCMTIDKNNLRHVDSQHNYQGMYSAGTESYMLDNSAIIVYTRPTKKWLEEHGESELPLEIQSKHKRGVFLLGEDKIVQCRTYPDGRDGGDNGLPAQLREIVQKTFADLLDTPNMWLLKKGSYECRKVTVEGEGYTHYRDYVEYDDGTVSYLKRVNGNLNKKKITVGAYCICPECGERHDSERHITCDDCFERSENDGNMCCDRCGECYDEDDGDAIETTDGHHYCCADCARDDDYVQCYDTDNWVCADDTYFDDWTEDYYEYNEEGIYIHENWYHNEETAREAGWAWSDWDDDWFESDSVFEIGNTGTYFSTLVNTDYVEIEVDGTTIYYPTSERAEEDGYTYDEENNEWVAA